MKNKTTQKLANSKIFYSAGSIFFIIIFSYFFGGEYYNFYNENKYLSESKKLLNETLETFSLEKINELKNIEILYTPDKKVIETIIGKIKKAENKIYIEVYMLTEKRIMRVLNKANKKGIEIKIILEKNPYLSYNINNKSYSLLEGLGIEVVWSNPKNYSLNHSKLLIIDEEAIISTGNLTHSSFNYNRDFFVFIKDKKIVNKLTQIFLSDFDGKNNYIYDDNLVLSPYYSRKKIEYLLNNAEKKIDLYIPYIQDEKLENILIYKKNLDRVDISIILSKDGYNGNKEKIKKLENIGIKIKKMEKHTMHSKAIIIDNKYLFIGSINFSNYSLDKNREIGILLKNENLIKNFINIFNNDFLNNTK